MKTKAMDKMSLLEKASPRVKQIVEALGVRVMSLNEFDKEVGMSQKVRAQAICNAGFYNVARDIVVINVDTPNAIKILDRTILHEVGHWSGHISRMSRKVMVYTEMRKPYTEIDEENEEMVAEMIAFRLGTELGIMTKDWQSRCENYIATFTKGDFRDAAVDANRAMWYLLKLAAPNIKVS